MTLRTISDIKTRIVKRNLLIIIEFKEGGHIFATQREIFLLTKLQVFEIELLIGSMAQVWYYEENEKMVNGRICLTNNQFVKKYSIKLEDSIDELKLNKSHLLLPFRKITKIFHFNKNGNNTVGIKTSIEDETIFIYLKRFEALTQLNKDEMFILNGSYIYPEFYKAGEILASGNKVQKDNILLKSLNLRFWGTLDEMEDSALDNLNESGRSERNYESKTSHSEYGGVSDGYGGYLDDDFINDALGGDPDAYWNID